MHISVQNHITFKILSLVFIFCVAAVYQEDKREFHLALTVSLVVTGVVVIALVCLAGGNYWTRTRMKRYELEYHIGHTIFTHILFLSYLEKLYCVLYNITMTVFRLHKFCENVLW